MVNEKVLGQLLLVFTALLALVKDAVGVECYRCTFIAFRGDSQGACSDPWPWYRDSFPDLAPPIEQCQHACVKIVMFNQNKRSSVVRGCGPPCSELKNETITDTTESTCCENDMCNGTGRTATTWHVLAMTSLVGVVIRTYIVDFFA